MKTPQICTNDPNVLADYVSAFPTIESPALDEFIKRISVGKQRTISKVYGSYSLKHVAERLARKNGYYAYVSNEQLIVALVRAGFTAKNIASFNDRPGPNYYFNISSRLVSKIDDEARNLS